MWAAAFRGDAPALEAALAAGGSTEEADRVSAMAVRRFVTQLCTVIRLCVLPASLANSQNGITGMFTASGNGKIDSLRILIAAGGDVAAISKVCM